MMTQEQVQAMRDELEQLKAENDALKNPAKKERALSVKITEKGGLSVYGMGRFPLTLYKTQWEKLITFIPQIADFITANADKLSVKTTTKVVSNADAHKVVQIQSLGYAPGDDAA